MQEERTYRIMISGGGTGGHIYPAISIGQSLKMILRNVELLFVGAEGKMEMKKVPEAGFEIVGLWISGIQRRVSWQNLLFPIKLISSIWKSFQLLSRFKPDVVVGVGGYASGPLLWAATVKKIPTLIQEQNSYAGLTNKWLAKRVNTICVAHEGMEIHFPSEKLKVTGNPVRGNLVIRNDERKSAMMHFNLDATKPTLLVLGGSLGARTINESTLAALDGLLTAGIQVIWQTGSFYLEEMKRRAAIREGSSVRMVDFIREMRYAYGVADVVVSRAGALSLAELMITGKPSILIPSPNVAEDHQTKNARALVERDAALMIPDQEAVDRMELEVKRLLTDNQLKERLSMNIKAMAHPDASTDIANEVIKLVA
jgi:UDP-N-acetylglucosamine--N-acetylmuramyl-(pentapeptide) pyrophosphoryl-undecaprenol N-acetylglucosamine transferase